MLDYVLKNCKKKRHIQGENVEMYLTACFELNKTMFWDYLMLAQYIDQHIRLTIFTDHWIVNGKQKEMVNYSHESYIEGAITFTFFKQY